MGRARQPVLYQPIPPDRVARIRRSALPIGLLVFGLLPAVLLAGYGGFATLFVRQVVRWP